jgi:hypothetical protein
MFIAGVDPQTIAEYEAHKLAIESAQGQAAFYTRHPEVARSPEQQQRVNETMAKDPERYRRVGQAAGPDAAYELAYGESQAQQAPTPGADVPGGRVRPGRELGDRFGKESRDRLGAIQEHFKNTGDFVGAARALGARIEHPGMDDAGWGARAEDTR